MMKKWKNPVLETLEVEKTLQGQHIAPEYDEIRVDQNGNYWASFTSGEDSKPGTNGPIIVPHN